MCVCVCVCCLRVFFFFTEVWVIRKFTQVARTLQSILADLKVWMDSIIPLISCSPRLFSRSLATIPRILSTIVIISTFMFYTFSSLLKDTNIYLSSLSFIQLFIRKSKSTSWQDFFCFVNTKSGLLTRIGWSVSISKSQKTWCISFSRKNSGFLFRPK